MHLFVLWVDTINLLQFTAAGTVPTGSVLNVPPSSFIMIVMSYEWLQNIAKNATCTDLEKSLVGVGVSFQKC